LSENYLSKIPENLRRTFNVLTVCLMLTLVSFGAHAVILKDLILFSAVKGRVLDHGKPAAGLKIERSTFWNMDKFPRQEFTTTDNEGYFYFPETRGTADFGFLAKLFHVPTVSQRLYLQQSGKEVLLYANSRGNYESSTETGYEDIQLSCDLKDEKSASDDFYNIRCEVRKK
jgi:hypothetical protein